MNPEEPVPFVVSQSPRCKCSHPEALHKINVRGRAGCSSTACGCRIFRDDKAEVARA